MAARRRKSAAGSWKPAGGGSCWSMDNPSASGSHAWETVCDYEKGTWHERCRYCKIESGRKGQI